MLEVRDLDAAYGELRALVGVGIQVGSDEIVALVGSNGAGKTTLLRCIAGLTRPRAGRVLWQGQDLGGLAAHRVVERGVAMVPEGRRLFGHMTVEENLSLGAFSPRARPERQATLDRVYQIFPRLAERRRQLAGALSGGEQQMVAIGRALDDPAEPPHAGRALARARAARGGVAARRARGDQPGGRGGLPRRAERQGGARSRASRLPARARSGRGGGPRRGRPVRSRGRRPISGPLAVEP